jgi:uncharacterized protein YbaR (Trm112 family)
MGSTLDDRLLGILACPQDKGPLLFLADEDLLYNPRLRVAYPVRDNIPVMLVDESRPVDAAEHERLLALVAQRGIKPTFTQ